MLFIYFIYEKLIRLKFLVSSLLRIFSAAEHVFEMFAYLTGHWPNCEFLDFNGHIYKFLQTFFPLLATKFPQILILSAFS